MFKKRTKFKRGLILLELVVALGIFLSVMTIGMGALLTMYGLNKKSQTLKTIMTDLNFTVESMAREIVVGTDYHCDVNNFTGYEGKSCDIPGGGRFLTFCSSNKQQIFYRYEPGSQTIQRYIEEDDDEETCGTGNPANNPNLWKTVTSSEVNIEYMRFYVEGAESSLPEEQPKVHIVIEGNAGLGENMSDFKINTSLSQRAPKLQTN